MHGNVFLFLWLIDLHIFLEYCLILLEIEIAFKPSNTIVCTVNSLVQIINNENNTVALIVPLEINKTGIL